jgi:hypothetical protein
MNELNGEKVYRSTEGVGTRKQMKEQFKENK